MTKPVCLIVGAGAGIGGNVAKRFAREGHHACLARRSDRAGLDRRVAEIEHRKFKRPIQVRQAPCKPTPPLDPGPAHSSTA